MAISKVTWKALLEGTGREKSETVQAWLRRWAFDNDGAVLICQRGNIKIPPASLEENQAILVLMTKGRWQTTLH